MRLPNFVGEVVMAVPMLHMLAGSGLDVRAFGRPWSRELLASVPVRCDTVARGRGEARQYRRIGAVWGLAVRTSWTTAFTMRRASLKVIGRRGNLRSLLLHHPLPRRFEGHRVDELLDLGRKAAAVVSGVTPTAAALPAVPTLSATADQMDAAAERLRAAGVTRPYVFVCPTAGHRQASSVKLWPAFPAFMRQLVAEGRAVVACPGPGELEWYGSMPDGVRVFTGVGVGELAGVITSAASVVSNDTGAAHLAAALGRPTLTIFGDSEPARYAPRGRRAAHLGELGAWPSLEEGLNAWRRLSSDV